MNLQEVSQLSSIIGAVGVLVSIGYLAYEVRKHARAVRTSALDQVIDTLSSLAFEIAKDGDLAGLVDRAGENFDALEDVDKTRYFFLALSYLRRAEFIHYHKTAGHLEGGTWRGICASMRQFPDAPGAQQCWRQIQARFNAGFRAFVDAEILTPAGAATG